MKEPSPSQSRHKASRKGRDLRALWDWNDEVNEGIWIFLAAVVPVKLVFVLEAQECSSRNLLTYCSSAEFGSNMFLDNV